MIYLVCVGESFLWGRDNPANQKSYIKTRDKCCINYFALYDVANVRTKAAELDISIDHHEWVRKNTPRHSEGCLCFELELTRGAHTHNGSSSTHRELAMTRI